MTQPRWIRQTAVLIGTISIRDLDIHFDITSSASENTKATATIKIWNISQDTLRGINPGDRVTVWAGYLEDTGVIYMGRVDTITRRRSGADTYAEITCVDYTLPYGMQPRMWPKGTAIATILNRLCLDADLIPGEYIHDLGITLSGPYTTETSGSATLNAMLEMINKDPEVKSRGLSVHASMIGGEFCVMAGNQTTSDIHIITPDTGLLETAPETSDDCERSVTTLLNWRIQVDAQIQLATTLSGGDGRYKIVSYAHKCNDTQYTTTLKLTSLTEK